MGQAKRRVAVIVALAALAACTQSVDIQVLESNGVYEPDVSRATVAFRTNRPIDRHIDSSEVRPAEGLISICGLADRYYAYAPVETLANAGHYRVVLPGMEQRLQRSPDGQVSAGWPADLARRTGVCFQVEASEMMWITLRSNTVTLPRSP